MIVLREARDGFELLMVTRPDRGPFGGLVVFPGGKVEDVDVSELANAVVMSTADDREFRSAVLRELAEETGLLLTSRGLETSPVLSGEDLFREILASDEQLPGDDLILVSRWVTPVVAARRFDTRFYLLAGKVVPEVRLDRDELMDFAWVTPSAALDRYNRGEWPMILPTISHLRWLASRESIDDAQQSAKGADGRTLITPKLLEDGSLLPVYLPADD